MERSEFPTTLARAALRIMPPGLIGRGAGLLMRRMARAHPDLFARLAALEPATIRIEPTDLPHGFVLTLGAGAPHLALAGAADAPATTCLRGEFATLIDLLEGRIDGDMVFFSRALTLTGDSAPVVALRNTLDRESMNLLDEAAALLGPLARPARAVAHRLDRRLETLGNAVRRRLARLHAGLHEAGSTPVAASAGAPELAALRTDMRRRASGLPRLERKATAKEDQPA